MGEIKMTLNKKIAGGIITILLIMAASYFIEITYKQTGLKSGAIIKISSNNQPAAFFGSDVLKKLPGGAEGPSGEGPTLKSVLASAGISDFNKVEILGVNESSSFVARQQDISDDLIFYYTDHGTVNLAKKSNSQSVLVEDVSEINASD